MAEEDEVEVILAQEPAADQEVPREAVLPEQSPGEFDFNEFFNLDKVPCLASVSVAAHYEMEEATIWLNLIYVFNTCPFEILFLFVTGLGDFRLYFFVYLNLYPTVCF